MSRKPSRRRRFIPALPDYELDHLIGRLAPPERRALAQICETADVLTVEQRAWLLVPADTQLLDTLAVFGAEAEDREMDLEDEAQADDEPSIGGSTHDEREFDDCDLEDDCPAARKRFARERQGPGVTYNGITNGRYAHSKDWGELGRMERAVARLPNRR